MFNPNEFKEVADNVLNFESLPDEGKFRTAIGRYYYYIFLKIREIVKEVEKDRDNGIYGPRCHCYGDCNCRFCKLGRQFCKISN